MSAHRWNDVEREVLGALRSNVTRPTDDERRSLRERLARSAELAPASSTPLRLARASGPAHKRRFLGAALAALSSPISLAAAFSAGGITGAVVYATVQHVRAPVHVQSVHARRPSTPPAVRSGRASSAPLPISETAAPVRPDDSAPQRPPVGSLPVPSPSPAAEPAAVTRSSGSETLAAQRALLDTARAALGRGNSAAALDALDAHQREFPNSVLSEEREALAIKALAGAGRRAEAEARGARFRSRYPNSILRPAIDDALGTIP
jgi:hypothetical protein